LTTAELKKRLQDREIPEPAIAQVIERLTADGTLDDRRAAMAIASARSGSACAPVTSRTRPNSAGCMRTSRGSVSGQTRSSRC
jgi:SOS response regulatory protein OraA/RecX